MLVLVVGAGIGWLCDALDEAGLTVDDIRIATGQPPAAPTAGSGRFVDRSA